MRRVVVSPEAQADLEEIKAYVVEHRPQTAVRFLTSLTDAIEALQDEAHIHGHHPLTGPGLRRLQRHEHLIFFIVSDHQVDVVGVVNGGRDLLARLEARVDR